MIRNWSFSCRASEFPRDYDGACLQMRLAYSPAAHFLLFLVRWTNCSLAGALGLLRILIYKVLCSHNLTSILYPVAYFREFRSYLFTIFFIMQEVKWSC